MHATRSRCSTWLPALGLLACSSPALLAQTTNPGTEPQAPASTPATAPTTVPASSVPSMPAPVPGSPSDLTTMPPAAGQTPNQLPSGSPSQSQTATPAQQQPYRDPLERPIVVPASPSGTAPAPGSAMPVPAEPVPGTAPSPVSVSMPSPETAASLASMPAAQIPILPESDHTDALGSTYIPDDSPVYPMALRLYSLGYLDSVFISMRPWTRRSLLHALTMTAPDIMDSNDQEAIALLARLQTYLQAEVPPNGQTRGRVEGLESAYTRLMGIGGTPLRDSYHLGQTLVNDYGRPYEHGFNNITGFSSVNEWGRFSLYVRGEYQHAPSAPGYSYTLASYLSGVDQIPFPGTNNYQLHQDTIPYGPLPAANPFRIQEAALSYHLLGHEVSFGKSDLWLGPGYGGSMAWSNNAEDVYGFRINRIEPMHIPLLDKIIGPIRYDFLVGSLQGHSYPNHPYINQVMVAIQPYKDFTFSIQKSVIWGGHGHGCLQPDGTITPCTEPITLHTFFKSFFDIGDTTGAEKYSRDDPGARFSSATFSWRLPFLRHYLTLYTDSTTHDDDLPVSAPRRAGWRPGLYLSQVPGVPKLDIRAEGTYTDYVTLRSIGGQGNYFETVQRQGYTSKGFIIGDWIGREGKGGQAWATYHLSADDSIQVEFLHKKTAKDFIAYGVSQTDVKVEAVKHFRHDLEADAWVQYERWAAPVYLAGPQTDVTGAVQLTWWPKLKTARGVEPQQP